MSEVGLLTKENFWKHAFVKSLNVRGRFALCYLTYCVEDQENIILEDMAAFLDLEIGECEQWLEFFVQQGRLSPKVSYS